MSCKSIIVSIAYLQSANNASFRDLLSSKSVATDVVPSTTALMIAPVYS